MFYTASSSRDGGAGVGGEEAEARVRGGVAGGDDEGGDAGGTTELCGGLLATEERDGAGEEVEAAAAEAENTVAGAGSSTLRLQKGQALFVTSHLSTQFRW